MKMIYLLTPILFAQLCFVSCGYKVSKPTPSDSFDTHSDSTLYGVLGESYAMSSVQLIGDNGDTLVLYKDSPITGHKAIIVGGLVSGNRYAYTLIDSLSVGKMINLSLLTQSWIQPIHGIEGVQGINLTADGKANSINMATLKYRNWSIWNCKLIFELESIGNQQSVVMTDTVDIELLSTDSLHLNYGASLVEKYSHQ